MAGAALELAQVVGRIGSIHGGHRPDERISRRRSGTGHGHIGPHEFFVGIILIPIIGNVAEHLVAVQVALKNQMELSLSIALGSSLQIALSSRQCWSLSACCSATRWR